MEPDCKPRRLHLLSEAFAQEGVICAASNKSVKRNKPAFEWMNASPPPSPRRILLIQLRAIGDVILTTPVIRVLKKYFPESQVDFLANPIPAEILRGNPYVHRILVYPYNANDLIGLLRQSFALHKNEYDVVIDFLGTAATAAMTLFSGAPLRIGYRLRVRRYAYNRHELEYRQDVYNALTKFSLLKPLGIMEEESATEIFISQEAKDWAECFFREAGLNAQHPVALAPGAKRAARRWRPDRFAQVASWLQEQGHQVILVWGPGEREYVQAIGKQMAPEPLLSPPMTLMQLAALLEKCKLLICNCGGAKHVAVAVGTPTFTIHGPTNPEVWTPPHDLRHAFVRGDLNSTETVTVAQVIEGIQKMELLGC